MVVAVLAITVLAVAATWLWTRPGSTSAAGAAAGGATVTSSPPADATSGVPEADGSPTATATDSPGSGATDPLTVGGGTTVDPVVTFADWVDPTASVEVNGYVGGILESEGNCVLSLSRGADDLIVETVARPDASTMVCGLMQVAGADLEPGTWQAVLSYRSDTATGTSPAVDVEVPVR